MNQHQNPLCTFIPKSMSSYKSIHRNSKKLHWNKLIAYDITLIQIFYSNIIQFFIAYT